MALRELVITARKSAVFLLVFLSSCHLQGLVQGKLENLQAPGNTIIGTVESICVSTPSSSCAGFDIHGLLKVEAILYAIENVNKQAKEIGLNGTVGYDIRDTQKGTYRTVLDLVLAHPKGSRNTPLVVVGSLPYADSLLLLLSQQITHISCDSSSPKIPNSEKVFHVHPSDQTSVRAIVDLIARNKWSYVGVVADSDSSDMVSVLKAEAVEKDVCIGTSYTIPSSADEQQIAQFVKILNAGKNFTVIVAFTSNAITRQILTEASRQKVKRLTWITGQRAWSNTRPIPQPNSASQGMFSILTRTSVPGFVDHLRSLSTGTKKIENIWLREMASSSRPTPPALNSSAAPLVTRSPVEVNVTTQPPAPTTVGPTTSSCDYDADPLCGMDQAKLKAAVDKMISTVEESACSIDAVFTVARAVAAKQRCVNNPDCKQDVKKLNEFVQQVDFINPLTGRRISFTPRGYLNYTLYHVYNYQRNYSRITTELNNDLKAVDVGTWAHSPETQPRLKISEQRIEWHGGYSKRSESRCHEECPAGKHKERKKTQEGAGCCWYCKKCSPLEYSDTKDSLSCKKCPEHYRPSLSQIECYPYYEDYVHWDHAGSLLVLFLMVVGISFSVYVGVVLFRNSDTPAVTKAKSAVLWMLPFVILIFLLPIPLLGRPTVSSCEGYRIFFVIALGIPLAVLIAKSQFFDNRCKDKSENGNKMCTPRLAIVFFVVLCHVLLAIVCALVAPATVVYLPTEDPYTVFLECASHSEFAFLFLIMYVMILAVVVTVMSFNEVITEENNYEVKWISFAMFNWYCITFFYVVFLFGVDRHAKVIMLAIMDLLFAVNLFVFFYIPKWYIVVFRPEKNRSDVSPWTDYIKTQQRVSERLSAPDDSPMFNKKGKGNADDETEQPEAKGLMTDTDL